MHMLRKGEVRGVGKGDDTGQMTFITRPFGGVPKLNEMMRLHPISRMGCVSVTERVSERPVSSS
jgi:hypothetical protein